MNGRQDEKPTKEQSETRQPLPQGGTVLRNEDLSEVIGDLRDLVRHTDEDESADRDVQHWAPGDEDQNPPRVRRQPDVILANEQL